MRYGLRSRFELIKYYAVHHSSDAKFNDRTVNERTNKRKLNDIKSERGKGREKKTINGGARASAGKEIPAKLRVHKWSNSMECKFV